MEFAYLFTFVKIGGSQKLSTLSLTGGSNYFQFLLIGYRFGIFLL